MFEKNRANYRLGPAPYYVTILTNSPDGKFQLVDSWQKRVKFSGQVKRTPPKNHNKSPCP